MSEAPAPVAPGGPPQPANAQEAMMAIQAHRAAIVEAQHKVIKRLISVPEYNAVYAQHLAAIHALEAWLHDFQTRGSGSAAGLY